MPLVSIENITSDVRLATWKATESATDLYARYPMLTPLRPVFSQLYKSESRHKEALIEHILLFLLYNRPTVSDTKAELALHTATIENQQEAILLNHHDDGSPYLSNGHYISISHTKELVTVIVSTHHAVAIDVEYQSDRVARIAPKLLRPDETASSILHLLLHWCAKETLYKLLSAQHLGLNQMRIQAITGNNTEGQIEIENLVQQQVFTLCYKIKLPYIMAYAIVSPHAIK